MGSSVWPASSCFQQPFHDLAVSSSFFGPPVFQMGPIVSPLQAGSAPAWTPHNLFERGASKPSTTQARQQKNKRTRGGATTPATDKKRRPPQAQNNTDEGRAMPEVAEEDWQRRIQHRSAAVHYIKSTATYQKLAVAREQGLAEAATRPRTPDPTDRSVSKRDWEKSVQKWRSELQSWAN